jgi:excisionase family DNA binding protein
MRLASSPHSVPSAAIPGCVLGAIHTVAQADRPSVTAPAFSREEILTATEVAEVLRVQPATALDYMRRGVIPAAKIGRRWYAHRSQLERHLAGLLERAG